MKKIKNYINKRFFARSTVEKELITLKSRYETLLSIAEDGDWESAKIYSKYYNISFGICKYLHIKLGIRFNREESIYLFGTCLFLGENSIGTFLCYGSASGIQIRIDWLNNITEEQLNILVKLYKES